jgi:hypothetical protein
MKLEIIKIIKNIANGPNIEARLKAKKISCSTEIR